MSTLSTHLEAVECPASELEPAGLLVEREISKKRLGFYYSDMTPVPTFKVNLGCQKFNTPSGAQLTTFPG
jgi:hypothetical protein